MRATRMVLVLILLAAMTSTGQAQLLPRRRVGVAVGKITADFGGRVTIDALTEGLNQAMDDLGSVLDLQLSLQLFAQIQMSPQALQRIKSGTQQDLPKQDCLSLLLAETARLAARLEDEKFSPPVLEKMYLDYEGIDSAKPVAGDVKGSLWSSRQIYLGGTSDKGDPRKDLSEDLPGRRSVKCIERHRPKDPGSKSPMSVHCSFVFLTTKERQEFRKMVDFDLYLDKQKTEGSTPACPWKVKNVQYDRPSPADEHRP